MLIIPVSFPQPSSPVPAFTYMYPLSTMPAAARTWVNILRPSSFVKEKYRSNVIIDTAEGKRNLRKIDSRLPSRGYQMSFECLLLSKEHAYERANGEEKQEKPMRPHA